jgi:predicted short-subunit dehydrogenase-like oxidoreductase (DUF2520 family)
MIISFIGAGKVATSLGKYFADKGVNVGGYYSKSFESAKTAAELTHSTAYGDYNTLIKNCDILFITTPDDYIKETCDKLSRENCLREGLIILHTSGALPSSLLSSAKQHGCYIYSLHPLQSFASFESSIESLPQTIFSLEGDTEKLGVIKGLIKQLGNEYFIIKTQDKVLYHAAAAIVSNYLATLVDCGLDIFEHLSIDRSTALRALIPLVEGTLNNIKKLDTAKALTGPIARGDMGTVKKHIEEIKTNIPEKLPLYRALGNLTVDLALKEKLKDEKIGMQLKKMLEGKINGE